MHTFLYVPRTDVEHCCTWMVNVINHCLINKVQAWTCLKQYLCANNNKSSAHVIKKNASVMTLSIHVQPCSTSVLGTYRNMCMSPLVFHLPGQFCVLDRWKKFTMDSHHNSGNIFQHLWHYPWLGTIFVCCFYMLTKSWLCLHLFESCCEQLDHVDIDFDVITSQNSTWKQTDVKETWV